MSSIEPVAGIDPVAKSRAVSGQSGRRVPGDALPAITRLGRLIGPPAAALAIVVAGWYLVTYAVLDDRRRFLLPAPDRVVAVGFGDPTNLARILEALGTTAVVALAGLAIATVLGIGIAVAMSQAPWAERSIFPWAVVLQTIPILAVVPLIGFWFGFGTPSRLIVCVLIALFPILTNTLFGLKSVDRGHRDLFTLHGATRRQRLVKLQLPGAMPAIFTGLRISAGLSVIGAIVADFFFRQGEPGIGRLIDQYTQRLQSEQLFAAILLSSLFGLTVFWLFGVLGRVAVGPWFETVHDQG
jgi:NitT/TauT family transport system permease protein